VGLFGLVSYTVVQRRREFGIRLALGAEGWRVWRMVLREGAVLAALGLAAGILVAAASTRSIASLLFETSATDGATFVGASIVVAAVTMLACYLPARRAASVNPAIVLRDE
jgi:ABC-type antimicrobial peptide transport system permease subunit